MEQIIKVTDINTSDVDMIWPQVKAYLQQAIDRNQGEFTLDDVHLGLITGFMTLWIAYDKKGKILAAAVCEMRDFAKRKICYLLLMAGDGFDDWSWAINSIEDWALQNGADAVAAYTRRGFVKPMKDYGYREVYTVIQKELNERRYH